jgi:hypothetical protein
LEQVRRVLQRLVLEQLPQLLSVVLQLDMQLATIRDNGLRDIFTRNSFQIRKHSLKPAPQQSQNHCLNQFLSLRLHQLHQETKENGLV